MNRKSEFCLPQLAIVTGAPGWLGSSLITALIKGLPDFADQPALSRASERAIRALVLRGSDTGELQSLDGDLNFVEGDLASGAGLEQLMKDAPGATVFHIAGVIHPRKLRQEFYDVNVEGTRRLLEASARAGVRRFIYVSSNAPIGCNQNSDPGQIFDEKAPYHPYMHYGQSKKQGEELVNQAHKNGLETVIIRPPWFYGPRQPARQTLFFTMIKKGKMPIVGSGTNLRSMAYVDNICQALILSEKIDQANGKTYWIADERPYTMNEIVDTVERLLEKEFNIVCAHKRMHLPNLASEVALLVDGTLQGLGLYNQKFHVLSEMNKNIACKIDLAKAELGYNPRIALEEGMRRSIKWILDRGQTI